MFLCVILIFEFYNTKLCGYTVIGGIQKSRISVSQMTEKELKTELAAVSTAIVDTTQRLTQMKNVSHVMISCLLR